jgi:hypothetical protein
MIMQYKGYVLSFSVVTENIGKVLKIATRDG